MDELKATLRISYLRENAITNLTFIWIRYSSLKNQMKSVYCMLLPNQKLLKFSEIWANMPINIVIWTNYKSILIANQNFIVILK
jgi:hypothetical protein